MNNFFKEGSVVICDTGQAGTVTHLDGSDASVLLRNSEMWHGMVNRLRAPQSQADLDACPIEVEKTPKLQKISRD